MRPATDADLRSVLAVINDAAEAYRGVIPADCWHRPYMTERALRREVGDGVRFWVIEVGGAVVAAMGLQAVRDVTLIRHAYVAREHQRTGLGGTLLEQLRSRSERPMLVGTWRAATWAVAFYRRHGFELLPDGEAQRLLRRYWSVPARQMAASVVLADSRWQAAPSE